jgi:DNA-binding Xre family transcriptional regulator
MHPDTYPAAVAETVSRAIEAAGFNPSTLSEATGISRMTLTRRLVAGNFTVSELAAIARALHTTPDDLIKPASAAS